MGISEQPVDTSVYSKEKLEINLHNLPTTKYKCVLLPQSSDYMLNIPQPLHDVDLRYAPLYS